MVALWKIGSASLAFLVIGCVTPADEGASVADQLDVNFDIQSPAEIAAGQANDLEEDDIDLGKRRRCIKSGGYWVVGRGNKGCIGGDSS